MKSRRPGRSSGYVASYTVAAGDDEIADASQIPVSVVLTDAAGNSNEAFTTSPAASAAPAIDPNPPAGCRSMSAA